MYYDNNIFEWPRMRCRNFSLGPRYTWKRLYFAVFVVDIGLYPPFVLDEMELPFLNVRSVVHTLKISNKMDKLLRDTYQKEELPPLNTLPFS